MLREEHQNTAVLRMASRVVAAMFEAEEEGIYQRRGALYAMEGSCRLLVSLGSHRDGKVRAYVSRIILELCEEESMLQSLYMEGDI